MRKFWRLSLILGLCVAAASPVLAQQRARGARTTTAANPNATAAAPAATAAANAADESAPAARPAAQNRTAPGQGGPNGAPGFPGFPGGRQGVRLNMGVMSLQNRAAQAAAADGKLDIAKFKAELLALLVKGDKNKDGVLDADEQEALEAKANDMFANFRDEKERVDLSKLPEQFPEELKAQL
ncbi:MAG: hypothetical protein HUK22_00675, partial [Thermoguttaceae bacterium]|nr:hypothetical protein [Thermoguttaceae bacterium]